jgi:hypothetical protein
MHYLRVPKLRIWFHNQSIHSTPLDQNWWLEVFFSISETLGNSKDAKLVFRTWMHYFVVQKLEKSFITKAYTLLQLTQIHWECFGAFQKPSECKMIQNLCFEPECTIFGCQSCKKRFVTKASILLQWTQNEGREILGAFCKPSECKTMWNLCFGP